MEDKEFSSINVIPLVDIMLVLLTIVLTTATFMVQGSLDVNLPTAKATQEENLKALSITINKNGEIFFEGKRVSIKELEELLQTVDRDKTLHIYADRDLRLQGLVDLLDLLKRLGFKKVSLKTSHAT